MALTFKILGSATADSSTSGEDLYVVPSGKCAVVSSIVVVNELTANEFITIYVKVDGDATLYPVTPINFKVLASVSTGSPAGSRLVLELGVCLGPQDKLVGKTYDEDLECLVFGVERDL